MKHIIEHQIFEAATNFPNGVKIPEVSEITSLPSWKRIVSNFTVPAHSARKPIDIKKGTKNEIIIEGINSYDYRISPKGIIRYGGYTVARFNKDPYFFESIERIMDFIEIYSISIFSSVNKNIIIPFVMGEKMLPNISATTLKESKLPGGKSSLEALAIQAKKHGDADTVDKFLQGITDTEKSLVKDFEGLKSSNIFRILTNAFNITTKYYHVHPSQRAHNILQLQYDIAPYGLLAFYEEYGHEKERSFSCGMAISPGSWTGGPLHYSIAGRTELELEKNFIKIFARQYFDSAAHLNSLWSSERMSKFFKKITPQSTEEEVKNMLLEIVSDSVIENPKIYITTILFGTPDSGKKLQKALNIDDKEHQRAIVSALYPKIGVTPNFLIKTNKL